MYVNDGRTLVEAWVPAKLNLFLEVTGRRADGFHELDTLMLPIALWDTIIASATDEPSITLTAHWASRRTSCGIGSLPTPANNLVYRAFDLVQRKCLVNRGAMIQLTKRFPAEAGLGGGSSDAATALVVAAKIWNLDLSFSELHEMATELGSDVPFFLYSAVCRCRGRGEIVTPTRLRRELFFVVVRPPQGLSTADVFHGTEISESPFSSAQIAAELANGTIGRIGEHLFNRLQASAMRQSDWINRLAFLFDRLDVVAHQMTGSGSCYFGLCRNAKHARQLAQRLNSLDVGMAYAVRSANFPSSRRLHDRPSPN